MKTYLICVNLHWIYWIEHDKFLQARIWVEVKITFFIKMSEEEAHIMIDGTEEDRNAMSGRYRKTRKWPMDRRRQKVIIPYIISGSYNRKENANILRAFMEYEKKTCIKYVKCFSQH